VAAFLPLGFDMVETADMGWIQPSDLPVVLHPGRDTVQTVGWTAASDVAVVLQLGSDMVKVADKDWIEVPGVAVVALLQPGHGVVLVKASAVG